MGKNAERSSQRLGHQAHEYRVGQMQPNQQAAVVQPGISQKAGAVP